MIKATIWADTDREEDDGKTAINFDNTGYDNDNFVEMKIGEEVYGISLDEILSVLKCFEEERRRNSERDKSNP